MNNGHHEHETNPWIVTKIQDFLYFCCPECDVREPINSKEDFFKHAIENHPKAKYYLEELIKNEPDNLELVGDENNWHFDEYHTSDFLEGENKPIIEDFYITIFKRHNATFSEFCLYRCTLLSKLNWRFLI